MLYIVDCMVLDIESGSLIFLTVSILLILQMWSVVWEFHRPCYLLWYKLWSRWALRQAWWRVWSSPSTS